MADVNEEQRSILSTNSIIPEPDTLTKIVKRIRVMTYKLLPNEVDPDSLTDPTSSVITPDVIKAYAKCGGDFAEAIPFCLLRAKATFLRDANRNPADYDENLCRSIACEVLARRIVHSLSVDRLESVMSTRYRYREEDGDISSPVSALETAVDQDATIFLSSSEAQHVINSLWRGEWIQDYHDNDQIDYVPYNKQNSKSFWDHLNPHRLAVPRYQNIFSIAVWCFFLAVYSQAVRTPLENQPAQRLDWLEILLYILASSFFVDGLNRSWKALRLSTRPLAALSFWTLVNFTIHGLLLTALGFRIASLYMRDDDYADQLHLRSYQILSCVAPLIWMKLVTVFDGFKIIGVMQIVVFRQVESMLRDSAIFFILLAIMGAGFAQALFALDAADGQVQSASLIWNGLLQAMLGSPDFDSPSERFGYPFGLIIYYGWSILTIIILLNVLIALFGSSYSNVEENATDQYMAYYAYKTISMIRGPDTYVYPAPLNLVEIVIAPLEYVLPHHAWDRLNLAMMGTLLFVPLTLIAFFESTLNTTAHQRLKQYFSDDILEDEDDPELQDPEEAEEGTICKEKFADLVAVFPNTGLSASAALSQEIEKLQKQVAELQQMLKNQNGKAA
ncbi:Calcium channel yvc1 [Naganishia albida]|nr:Calcium channel yvc1 [Naganishia albida]